MSALWNAALRSLSYVAHAEPVLLVGEASTGKTHLVSNTADSCGDGAQVGVDTSDEVPALEAAPV